MARVRCRPVPSALAGLLLAGAVCAPRESVPQDRRVTEIRPATPAAAPAAARPAAATAHGLTIPQGHPRLWFDPARLARARAWWRKNSFTPARDDRIGQALRGLLGEDSASCRAAVEWGLGAATSLPIPMSGVACDNCRWFGEAIVLVYDWCHQVFTPEERARYLASHNAWMEVWRTAAWGAPPGHQGNYYWGYLRNQLLWAVATFEDNAEVAGRFLEDVFETRLARDFYPAARAGGDSAGGVGQEGSAYGQYLTDYMTIPLATAALLGRDLWTETPYWREAVYAAIYATTPAPTAHVSGATAYTYFPFGDDQNWTRIANGISGVTKPNFMAAAAMRWTDAPVGQHARHWLALTGPGAPDRWVRAVDPGGPTRTFADLPLDYWASGAMFLYGRSAWGPEATAFLLQLGDGRGRTGHPHADWGTWQLWRGGRFLSRETASYGDPVAGYAGGPKISSAQALGHNSVLVDGVGIRTNAFSVGNAVVRRLESRPTHAYAAVDLGPTGNNPAFPRWVREFVFVRGLETLVILDRLESKAAGATKTFLFHCETSPAVGERAVTCTHGPQALVVSTLVPAAARARAVAEGGPVGQHRVEIDTAPGAARSHILTVLQAKPTGAPALAPAVAEDDRSYAVTLDGATRIVFEKGLQSTGGSIAVGGAPSPFRTDVQAMEVGEDGPRWR